MKCSFAFCEDKSKGFHELYEDQVLRQIGHYIRYKNSTINY